MALKKCKECGHKISKKAKSCPNCASPQKKQTSTFTWLALILVGLVFITNMFQSNQEIEQKQQQAAAQQKKDLENSKYFKENEQKIIKEISSLIDKKQFQQVLSLTNKYKQAKNIELNKQRKIAKEQILLIELKTIPASESQKNLDKYKELAGMSPENKKYSDKVTHYQEKINRVKILQKGFSGWNGSHIALDRYLKKNMKDPDSYEHIETKYLDKGDHILLFTKYRARNGFGGMTIGNVTAKAAIDGRLIKIITSD